MKGITRKPRPKRDRRLDDTRSIAGSGNVFIDLGFDEAEARVMALRVELMMRRAGLKPELHLAAKT